MTATARQTRTIAVERPEFRTRLLLDQRNQRVKAMSYHYYTEIAPLTDFLVETAREHNLTKVVLIARGSDWQGCLERGFTLEGRIERYYHGAPGHYMAYFLTADRQATDRLEAKQELLQTVLDEPATQRPAALPPEELGNGYRLITAGPEIAEALATVYDQVFESYPSPLTDPDYIRELITSGEGLFLAVTDGHQIASAAAAEIDKENGNAEITNCATLPDYRGEGLMATLVAAVGAELDHRGIFARYSLARALSSGMNRVLHRAGYIYRGRLVNHGHIGGGFEDLNVWEQSRQA